MHVCPILLSCIFFPRLKSSENRKEISTRIFPNIPQYSMIVFKALRTLVTLFWSHTFRIILRHFEWIVWCSVKKKCKALYKIKSLIQTFTTSYRIVNISFNWILVCKFFFLFVVLNHISINHIQYATKPKSVQYWIIQKCLSLIGQCACTLLTFLSATSIECLCIFNIFHTTDSRNSNKDSTLP